MLMLQTMKLAKKMVDAMALSMTAREAVLMEMVMFRRLLAVLTRLRLGA